MTEKQTDPKTNGMSRRAFLKNSGLVAGGLVGGGLIGGLLTNQVQKKPEVAPAHESGGPQEARVFFSRGEDFDILSAATERIFPKDDLGPGAIELGVPYFIDKQLNTDWGSNAKEYMKGPFVLNMKDAGNHNSSKDQDSQGPNADTQIPVPSPRYQTKMTRAEIFTLGLREMDRVSQESYGKRFVEASPEQQDEILTDFEAGKYALAGAGSQNFFHLLRACTIEGAYCDPVYGGNKDMMGWKMKEYPGPRASYAAQVEAEEFVVLDQQSLRNYQGH